METRDGDEEEEKKALGKRLASCRELVKLKQEVAARELGVTKAALSAWETGRNMPNPLMLKKLAKLYRVSVDGMLWETPLSQDAMQVAAQFDALNGAQKTTLAAVLTAFVREGQGAPPGNHPMRRATDRQLIPSPIIHAHRRHDDPLGDEREASK